MKIDNNKLITLGVVLIGGFLVYKFIIKGGNKNNNNGGGSGTASGGKLSSTQITKMASDLFEAMDNYGTDWDIIFSTFQKIKTNADFDNLVIAYGTRTLNCGTGNPLCDDFTGDLVTSLVDELDSSELAEINEILAKNAVNRHIQ
jgi:hypothetical protein